MIDVYTLIQFYRYDVALTIKNIRANEIKKTNEKTTIDFAKKFGLDNALNSNLNQFAKMTMRG